MKTWDIGQKMYMRNLKVFFYVAMAYFSFQLVSNSNISVNIDETRRLARIEMQKQISMKKAELSKLRYIIETCLYLLWSHLDYFMLLGVPETLISRNKTQPESKYLREMFLNLNIWPFEMTSCMFSMLL